MGAGLLERSSELEALAAATAAAGSGHGSVVLVSGEAGIGKTSLLRAFTARLADDVRLLAAACDDLLAPRVLGPLRDLAAASDGPLAPALAPGRPVEEAFGALLEELAAARPACSSSRTSTGPTTRRSTCSATRSGGSRGCRPSSS